MLQRVNPCFQFVPVEQRSFAVNEKQVKNRMKSVMSIEKITKAMKMVAAAKMKGELARLENGRDFGFNSIDIMFKSDLYMQRKAPIIDSTNQRELLVPISSDRGLCGSINSSIVREMKSYLKAKGTDRVKVLPIGEKGSSALIRPFADIISTTYSELPSPANYPTIMALAEQISKQGEDVDKIVIYYNEFQSVISQTIRRMELLPRKQFLEMMKYQKLYNQTRPDKNTSNTALYELYLTSNLWVAILNNAASEQSARMNAMENASKNAKEIVEKLTLQYNKARQARITMELVEIISGASAL